MPSAKLTIVPVGVRFTVESDQYEPDPTFANVQICLLLTSRGTLSKTGASWATLKGAQAAVDRFNRFLGIAAAVDRHSQAKKAPRRDGCGNVIDDATMYYIEDKRSIVGNCMLFWCPDGAGYTTQINMAGTYTGVRARSMRDTDIAWPVDFILANVVQHVRRDHLTQAVHAQGETA